MTVDGGLLLYGVEQDDAGTATELLPLALAGAPERIANVSARRISPPPDIQVYAITSPTIPRAAPLLS